MIKTSDGTRVKAPCTRHCPRSSSGATLFLIPVGVYDPMRGWWDWDREDLDPCLGTGGTRIQVPEPPGSSMEVGRDVGADPPGGGRVFVRRGRVSDPDWT